MQLETEIRTDPSLRADRFVETWNAMKEQKQDAYREGRYDDLKTIRRTMRVMAESLGRDPQVESLLAIRKHELGITIDMGRSIGAELALQHGIDFGIGRGIGR